MDKSSLQHYLGIPVLVQLKNPLVGVAMGGRHLVPFAQDPASLQWIPVPLTTDGRVEATQVMQFATLLEVDGSDTMLEIRWAMPRPIPGTPQAVLATLIDMDSIAAVTRVLSASVPEPSLIISRG